ncbi:MAG: OmpH family outer membrane protein [Phycisphaeraceae bacterium]|nr:MAG: OmpH family outer membrane protein [Phycisphaeraceae bacterium]
MRHAERVLVYSALALALSAGWPGPGRPAVATLPQAAAAVEPQIKIATVDALALTERMFQSDAYRPAREAFDADARTKIQPQQDMLAGMRTRIQAMTQGSPEFQAAVGEYQQRAQALDQEMQSINQQFAQLRAAQVADAFAKVTAAADAVATRAGFTVVVASRQGMGDMTQAADPVIEMLARPLVKSPKEIDLTLRVAEELKLPPVLEILPVDPSAPAAAPAPSGGK